MYYTLMYQHGFCRPLLLGHTQVNPIGCIGIGASCIHKDYTLLQTQMLEEISPHTYMIKYILTARAASGRATTSSLITAISAILIPITAVSGANALAIAALECTTLTGNCTKECRDIVTKSVCCTVGGKLTAVPLITSIRAGSNPIASKGGRDTLLIATLKLGGAATYTKARKKIE